MHTCIDEYVCSLNETVVHGIAVSKSHDTRVYLNICFGRKNTKRNKDKFISEKLSMVVIQFRIRLAEINTNK